MTLSVQFGSERINFNLEFSERKSLGISVLPDMKVLVKAPLNTPIYKIKERVQKRASWIIKQQQYFQSFYPKTPGKRYVGGETLLYMGRQYRLRIIIGKQNEVRYKGRFFEITTKSKSKVKNLMKQWYRDHAKIKFAEIAEPNIQKFKKYKVEPSGLYIQEMSKRWGSCTPKGKIILNPELIKAPRKCIEYVIIHELCHLKHANHGSSFYKLQSVFMTDWTKWKEKLERILA